MDNLSAPRLPVIVIPLLVIVLTLSSCNAGSRRQLAEAKQAAVDTKRQVVDYLHAGDCPDAIATMNAGSGYGIGVFFRAHVYETCGDMDAAVDSLMPGESARRQPLAELEVLRLYDLKGLDISEEDEIIARIMEHTMHFSHNLTEYKDGPRRWNLDHLLFYMLLERMPFSRSFENDIGYLQWQIEAVQPDRIGGFFSGDGSGGYAPFYGVALLPEEQVWRAKRSRWLEEQLLEILESRGQLMAKLWGLQVAYLTRLRPWLQQCAFSYLELDGVNIDEEDFWTCKQEYFGSTGHCLIEKPGVTSISIRYRSSVTGTSEFRYIPRMGGMELIKSKILGGSSGATPTGHSLSTHWTPEVIDVSASLRRLGLTDLPDVDPMPPACDIETWDANHNGPPVTAFTEWFDQQRQNGNFHPWAYNPRTRYSLLACVQPQSPTDDQREPCRPLLGDD